MRASVALALLAAASLVAGCGMWKSHDEAPPATPAASGSPAGVEARLIGLGSGVSGKVRVVDRGDGANVLVSVANMPGGRFRVAFHERANCSSPNGFSAGAPWAPASTGKDPRDIIAPLFSNTEMNTEISVHVKGLHATGPDGVEGHSVVIYQGSAVTEARPDVPNNRIACGTFSPTHLLSF